LKKKKQEKSVTKMKLKSSVAFLLTLLLLRDSSSETTRQVNNKKIIINKCCRIGDLLNADGKCDPAQGIQLWAPRVFLPKKKTLYEKVGSLPPFLGYKEEQMPSECDTKDMFKSSDVLVIANGSLFVQHKHLTINNPEQYCVDQHFTIVCRQKDDSIMPANMKVIKLTKCCGPNEIYASSSCQQLNNTDPLYNQKLLSDNESLTVDFDYKFPDCGDSNEFAIAGPFSSSNYDLTTSNVRTESGKYFEHDQYCLDHVRTLDDYEGVKIFTCSEHYGTAPPITNHNDDTRFAIYSIGLLISVLFLVATLLVGFLLLSNHHLLHYKCQTSYITCLLFGDLLLAITQISGSNLNGYMCSIIAHLMHFFFLATFFWLNTMCFNIWWTFR
jgi:G protein-coupled receptor Mth (Methuselah protein)